MSIILHFKCIPSLRKMHALTHLCILERRWFPSTNPIRMTLTRHGKSFFRIKSQSIHSFDMLMAWKLTSITSCDGSDTFLSPLRSTWAVHSQQSSIEILIGPFLDVYFQIPTNQNFRSIKIMDAKIDTNPNTEFAHTPGFWLYYCLLVCFFMVCAFLVGVQDILTWTNMIHSIVLNNLFIIDYTLSITLGKRLTLWKWIQTTWKIQKSNLLGTIRQGNGIHEYKKVFLYRPPCNVFFTFSTHS